MAGYFKEINTAVSKLLWNNNRPRIRFKSMHRLKPHGGLSLPDFWSYYLSYQLPPSEEDQELNLLCSIRELRIYIERSARFRQSEQLFVCFGGHTKGHPVTKQRLSRWIVDAITLAYSSLCLQCPIGV